MLQYGQRALSAKMELVRSVDPRDDVAVLAMTATGSFLELDRPDADGKRRFRYRSSARVHGTRQEGEVVLAEPVLLGNRFTHGELRTSELLIVAAGPARPAEDFSVPGPLLFGPVEEAAVAGSNARRSCSTRSIEATPPVGTLPRRCSGQASRVM